MDLYNVAEKSFGKVLISLQLSNYYVLFYDYDYSVECVKSFYRRVKECNEALKVGELDLDLIEKESADVFGMSALSVAERFPLRTKLKMYGKKIKANQLNTVVRNFNEGAEVFILLAVHLLKNEQGFNNEQIKEWWQKIIDFSALYKVGMKDTDVQKYFQQEANLSIDIMGNSNGQ